MVQQPKYYFPTARSKLYFWRSHID